MPIQSTPFQAYLLGSRGPTDVRATAGWGQMLKLWTLFNYRLAQVIAGLPPPAAQARCKIADSEPVTLLWLVEDYITHMRHHLNQLIPGDHGAPGPFALSAPRT